MILLSYSNSSTKGTEILGSILYHSLVRPAIFVCVSKILNFENVSTFLKTFSTLILGSVFNDYVVFYGDVVCWREGGKRLVV